MGLWRIVSLWVGFLTCMAPQLGAADDVLLFANGDQLTGKIVELRENEVVFEHPLAGRMVLPLDEVAVQRGEPDSAPATAVAQAPVESPQAQPLEAPGTAQAQQERAEAPSEPEASPEQEPPVWERLVQLSSNGVRNLIPEAWQGRLSGGYNILRSTNEVERIRLNANARRTWGDFQLRLSGFYDFQETRRPQRRDVIKNRDTYGGSAEGRYNLTDWLFANAKYDYSQDQVRDIQHDLVQGYGIGLRLWKSDNFEFNVLPAAQAQYKVFPQAEYTWAALGSIGNEINYRFNETVRIEQDATYGIDPNNDQNYRYDFEAKLIIRLSRWVDGILSYETEFDNQILNNTPKDEERIVFSLGLPF